jgi:mRNA-degrading endonuclease YafQ of YafQ-DinJ toxin-antitoxin module
MQDGFDALCKHTQQEIQFCKDLLKFFKKRAQIEDEYAKSLAKLTQKSQYETSLG